MPRTSLNTPLLGARYWVLALMTLLAGTLLYGCRARENARASRDFMPGAQPTEDKSASMQAEEPPGAPGQTATAGKAAPAGGGNAMPRRKIIYRANLQLQVEEFESAHQNMRRLVQESGGYIASAQVSGATGSQRRGEWQVRIPVGSFQKFLHAASNLGELQSLRQDSDDVSEEFYDLQARIYNKKVEEQRLIMHLQKSTGKLREILEVEREISRVRGEIESMEGRLRLLKNLTDLTTVTISMAEVKDFKPPRPPSFGTEILRSFTGSLDELGKVGKAFVLAIVALVPWLLLLVILWWPLGAWIRRRRRAQNTLPPGKTHEPPIT